MVIGLRSRGTYNKWDGIARTTTQASSDFISFFNQWEWTEVVIHLAVCMCHNPHFPIKEILAGSCSLNQLLAEAHSGLGLLVRFVVEFLILLVFVYINLAVILTCINFVSLCLY